MGTVVITRYCFGDLSFGKSLHLSKCSRLAFEQIGVGAESVAYLVCARNCVKTKSETYLKNYVETNTTTDNLDIYNIMRAAGQIETMLGLTVNTKFDKTMIKKRIK